MHEPPDRPLVLPTRRDWLRRCGSGAGLLGLANLLGPRAWAAIDGEPDGTTLDPRPPHFPARAKRLVWIFVNGGPSQVDTWDHKPALERWAGRSIREFDASFDDTTGFFKEKVGGLMPSPFRFTRRGECGKWVSDLFPHLGAHVDRMAFVHSGFTESNNHSPALFMMNCGQPRMGLPCTGSWLTYGLGCESRDLPAFVVLSDPKGRGLPKGHAANWGAGFLPGIHQGTWLQPGAEPIRNLVPPRAVAGERQRRQIDLVRALHEASEVRAAAPLEAEIRSFELAYRMQSAAPEALDVEREPRSVRQLYGLDDPRCAHVARQCLVARRLLERGVRVVQLYSGGMENQLSWDGHEDIEGNHRQFASETDRPVAGLLEDLALRGLLDDTLVVWGGEFGRLPIAQTGAKPGRDHDPHAFTFWLAGGGVRGGTTYGATDEIGYRAAEHPVHVNDLHATLLHLMGLDHERLTYTYSGRAFRLTDVGGRVIHDLLA